MFVFFIRQIGTNSLLLSHPRVRLPWLQAANDPHQKPRRSEARRGLLHAVVLWLALLRLRLPLRVGPFASGSASTFVLLLRSGSLALAEPSLICPHVEPRQRPSFKATERPNQDER